MAARVQYLCPVPVEMFKPELVLSIDSRLRAECGRSLKDFQWFSTLKRVNKFMMHFVSVGIFDGDYLHMSFRMWAEDALIQVPTAHEIVQYGLAEHRRFKQPSRWASDITLQKMAAYGMVEFRDGVFWYGPFSVGVADLPDDRLFSGRTKFASSDPVRFPD